MVKNVSMSDWSCFWCSLSNLNDDNCEGFLFLGLGLQAIFLALMRMVRNRGSKWKTCFSQYFQHYLMRFCCVLRFLLCLSTLLYASCGVITWSWLKYEFLCQFVVARLYFYVFTNLFVPDQILASSTSKYLLLMLKAPLLCQSS